MIISNLPSLSNPATGDVIPIERNGAVTYKIDYDALAAAIISKLGDPVGVSHGGSGLAVSPSLLVNLASANADTIMKQSPRPGVYGVLPIANGGSGLSASPSALVNLASNAADNVMKDNPRPGVTGTLPVANGGTGATTVVGIRSALQIGSFFSVLSRQVGANSGTVSFNLSGGRGAGIFLISQNGVQASIYLIVVNPSIGASTTKLLGQDVTINTSTLSAVTLSLNSWSFVNLICNSDAWT